MTDEFTEAARAEAETRWPQRRAGHYVQQLAFLDGAEWARDHLAAQEPTDAEVLQERVARALYKNAEYYGPEPTQPSWDTRDGEERGEWMEIAATVLPIIAAEVRAASEKAWNEGHTEGRADEMHGGFPNPYRATEYETGDQA